MKQKQKRSSRNASLNSYLKKYVSFCVKKIVTTKSVMGEEVKAEDVVSALKNVPKKGDPKKT